jgi:hypothetical protein
MGLARTELDIGVYIRADEMWYGQDRTEGGLGLKIPVRSELVLQQRTVEAQLVLNIAEDLIQYCLRCHRGNRKIKDAEDLEIDMITADNPSNAGVRLVDAGGTTRDPYYIKVFLNKTFGYNTINITWAMCSDESLLVHYMNDLKQRFASAASGATPTERQRLGSMETEISQI